MSFAVKSLLNRKILLIVVLLLCVFILFSILLPDGRRTADWCKISSSDHFVKGQWNEIELTVTKDIDPLFLIADFHWISRRNADYLASGEGYYIPVKDNTYIYRFFIPENTEYSHGVVVLFLTPSGSWKDAVRVLTSHIITLGEESDEATEIYTYRPFVRYIKKNNTVPATIKTESAAARILVLFLLSAAACIVVSVLLKEIFSTSNSGNRFTASVIFLGISVLFLLCVLFLDISGLGDKVTDFIRYLFRISGYYRRRRFLQRPLLAGMVVLAAIIVYRLLIHSSLNSTVQCIIASSFLLTVFKLSLLISLHDVDAIAKKVYLGFRIDSAVQALLSLAICAAGIIRLRTFAK